MHRPSVCLGMARLIICTKAAENSLMGLWSEGGWPKSRAAFPTADVHQPRSLSQAPLHNGFVVVTSSNILTGKDLRRSLV